jgi:hypothetical protein
MIMWKFIHAAPLVKAKEQRNALVQNQMSTLKEVHKDLLRQILFQGKMTAFDALNYLVRTQTRADPAILVEIRHKTNLLTYDPPTGCYEIKAEFKEAIRRFLYKI